MTSKRTNMTRAIAILLAGSAAPALAQETASPVPTTAVAGLYGLEKNLHPGV